MREIKFRGWLPNIKKMTYEHTLEELTKGNLWNMDGETNCSIVWLQYTGLKDKNGKEIFEGDIVKYFDNKEHIVVVENIKELGTGMYLKRVGSGYYTLNPSVIRDYEVEVIGDIHNNPELLEVV